MNLNTGEIEEKHFSIEDVVSYSNIKIIHANDNKTPVKLLAIKVVIWLVIISLVAALFLI